jgi:anthranilate synthase component 1
MSTVGPGLPPLSPTRGEFRALAGQGNLLPVFAELAADLDTPLSAFLRLRPGPYAFLLESVEGGEKWARYSFLGSDPLMVFTAKGKRISVRRADGTIELLPGSDPSAALRELLSRFRPVPVPGLPRFQGGAVGFLSYDMIRHLERLPTLTTDDQKLPDAVFMFTDSLLVFDNLRHRLLVIANAHVTRTDPASLDRAYDTAAVKIGMLIGNLRRPARSPAPLSLPPLEPLVAWGTRIASTMDEAAFTDGAPGRGYRRGDAYQVVPSRRLDTELRADPFTVYRALRTVNPSPYLFFLRLGRPASWSSPEVPRLEDDRVEERPIMGHIRGRTEDEDMAGGRDAGGPERRHVMLVYPGRNDVAG